MSDITFFFLASGSWEVPAGCTSVTVECIGAGANGPGGAGAYSKTSNISITPGATCYISVGSGGASGGDSWFNKSADAAPSSTVDGCLAKGASTVTGGQSSACVGDIAYSGGNAGSNGGGGGAGGPSGAGKNGGSGSSGTGGGGGGGGANGGASSNGSNNSSNNGGAGGAGTAGSGGGSGGTSGSVNGGDGTNGGGGGGGYGKSFGGGGAGGDGGSDTAFVTYGCGGGGGGAGQNSSDARNGGSGGLFGGGGGKAKNGGTAGAGAPGIVVLHFTVPDSSVGEIDGVASVAGYAARLASASASASTDGTAAFVAAISGTCGAVAGYAASIGTAAGTASVSARQASLGSIAAGASPQAVPAFAAFISGSAAVYAFPPLKAVPELAGAGIAAGLEAIMTGQAGGMPPNSSVSAAEAALAAGTIITAGYAGALPASLFTARRTGFELETEISASPQDLSGPV